MTRFEELLSELRDLRLARDQSDARLLLRLIRAERDDIAVIIESGGTLSNFIQEFVRPSRFEGFKRGLAMVGEERAMEIGSDATIVAGHLTDAANAPEYSDACAAWAAEHHFPATAQTARRILMQTDPRKEVPLVVTKQDELARLRAENQALKAENRALKMRVTQLEGKSETYANASV